MQGMQVDQLFQTKDEKQFVDMQDKLQPFSPSGPTPTLPLITLALLLPPQCKLMYYPLHWTVLEQTNSVKYSISHHRQSPHNSSSPFDQGVCIATRTQALNHF